ncbi:hypothetical protein Goari_007791 [Gossypium aridum]|uniref:SGNH hydrolase-type esterase domain-containing protein n=1 Tax=Gossypium aridum TaxID=34290 RepID=A0A7J8XS41_GOSAI|nr:hypothetical protein [Gossypium aridum]
MRPNIVLFGDSITQESFRSGGWGASLADTYSRKADVVLRGYGGYNTRWALFLLHHLFPLVKLFFTFSVNLQMADQTVQFVTYSLKSPTSEECFYCIVVGSTKPPVATTIFLGANDAALAGRTSERQHVPVEEYKENLRKIVRHLKECSPTMLIVLITPPPIDEEGRMEYARETYGEKAMTLPERTNETTGVYAKGCIELAGELGVRSINLWSKMQETDGWQKKYLRDGLHLTAEGNAVVFDEVVKVFKEAWLDASEMPYDFPHHSEIDGKNPEKAFQQKCL